MDSYQSTVNSCSSLSQHKKKWDIKIVTISSTLWYIIFLVYVQLSELAKNASHVAQFGEAEQFMFQLAKIERYELRLNCMAYMGNFDELIGTTQPVSPIW